MFNENDVPSSSKVGSQAPLDAKGYFEDETDMLDVADYRPLYWYRNMKAINMESGLKFYWTESVKGLIPGGYVYPPGSVSFGFDYTGKTFNFVEILNKSIINSELNPLLEMPHTSGGFPAGTTIEDVNGLTFTEYVEMMHFPLVLAYIDTQPSVSLSPLSQSTVDVGHVLFDFLTWIFNKGIIKNGDKSIAGSVVGDRSNILIDHYFSVQLKANSSQSWDNQLINDTTDDSSLTESYVKTITLERGVHKFKVTLNYDEGVTEYSDNKGGVGVNLVSNLLEGQLISDFIIINVVNRFHAYMGYQGTSPTDAAIIPSQTGAFIQSYLNVDNTGSYSLLVPPGEATSEVSFYTPEFTAINVIDRNNSQNNISPEFTSSIVTIKVNGSNDEMNYIKWTRVSNATNETYFDVTVTQTN